MIVNRLAGTDDIQDRATFVGQSALDEWRKLFTVARKTAGDVGCAQSDCQLGEIDSGNIVDLAALHHRADISGSGKLPLGETVNAVVLDNISDVHVATHHVAEISQADRRG